MYKFINDQGSVLFVQRPREARDLQAFLDRQPRALPVRVPAPAPDAPRVRLRVMGYALLAFVVLALAAAAFFFNEDHTQEPFRPELTPGQRARAFRHP